MKQRDDRGGTDELVIRIPILSTSDAFGNERATEEHSGQRIEIEIVLEDDEVLVG